MKTAFVTGASGGIGRATVERFVRGGWQVAATMRTPESEAGASLAALPGVTVTRLDLEIPDTIETAVGAALERFGSLDVLVNNAGFGIYGPLESCPPDAIERQFRINVVGTLLTTRAVLPHFRQRRTGTVVMVSSVGGRTVFPLGALYHGSKFALEGISEALTFELGAIGARVAVIEPGSINTGFTRALEFHHDPSQEDYAAIVEAVRRNSPRPRDSPGPELVADAVWDAVHDATPRLRYVVGEDAAVAIAQREELDDAAYLAAVASRFGLA